MSENGDVTLGEIHRSVKRIEATIQPLVILPVRVENLKEDIDGLTKKVESVKAQSIFLSGLISGGGAVLNFLFGRH